MERKEILKIPYIEHEAAMFRMERIIKRLIAVLMLSQVAFSAIYIVLFKKGGKR